MKRYTFLKSINAYTKLIDISQYIDNCKSLEQSENQKIILWLIQWIDELKNKINLDVIVSYNNIQLLNDHVVGLNYETINYHYEKFFKLLKNLKYIPILPPLFTLKTMVQEAEKDRIGAEERIRNNFFKTIPEFNFTEDEMVDPNFNSDASKKLIEKIGGPIPTVLSMSVSYHNNPLMWPLLFHEYGHSVFSKVQYDPLKIKNWEDVYSHADSKKIDRKNISKWISEIYSDLYAVKCCGSNFLFAFYFHEILSREIHVLLNLTKDKKSFKTDSSHPPSYLRLLFIIKEVNKYGFCKDDELLAKLIEYNDSFNTKISNDISLIEKDYYELFEIIYRTSSENIEKIDFEFDLDLINKLYCNLSQNCPIGTIYRGNSLKTALKSYNEKFDIDSPNRINTIIYTGWKYLILGLMEKFYTSQATYPIEEFTNEYIFLMKNINYSIETSVIVSNFEEK